MSVLNSASGGALISGTSPLGISAFPFTLACWVKRVGTHSADGRFISLGNANDGANEHYTYAVATSELPQVMSRSNWNSASATVTQAAISTTVWVPSIAVYTSASSRALYFGANSNSNGDTLASGFTSGTHSINSSSGRFALGRSASNITRRFQGLIAHPAVWNKALTTDEINAFLGGGNPLAIAASNLRAYYSDTSLSGSTWSDVSGNGYHLTLEGGAVIDTTTAGPTVDAPPSSVISFTVAPTVSTRTGTSYTLTGTLSAQGQVFGVAVPHDAGTPSIAQIVAGKNAAGAAAAGAGSASTTTGSPHNFVLTVSGTGIAASPSHDIHYVGREPE